MSRFKCNICFTIVDEEPCPVCGNMSLVVMCKDDHVCRCITDIIDGVTICKTCGEFICPCGSHDVSVISRVTGYMADVAGWGKGKAQEFKDRHRVNIATGVNDEKF
jgi:hypothetical protein